jgi:hypothetical protein
MLDLRNDLSIMEGMLTLEATQNVFVAQPNNVEPTTFELVRCGVSHTGKRYYLYRRTRTVGKKNDKHTIVGYEVFSPLILKAGTVQLFPNGSTNTIEEDTEIYPGSSAFGRTASYCSSLERAEDRLSEMMQGGTITEIENVEPSNATVHTLKKSITSPRNPNSQQNYTFPDTEFTVQQFAELNGIGYPIASVFVRQSLENGIIQFLKKIKTTSGKGRPTNIYIKP